ncbi:MAG: hypothetical protein COW22_03440 [Chloroflexi bacterium CG15_BIG_FIL_POST_REV_8_21_14_020_46_15]|nr:MAG: hypothetical protein AUK39_02875 [Dehalococcoidia bacterium CG2_30_46_19]PIW40105.1 MAG: hypothetical protein COW22_03440 [Chloroflexi bacterium CG15_BIG_FIL_POST_REV_8_21_14_020_46_15]
MIVDELKDFRDKLMQYLAYRTKQINQHKGLTKEELADFELIYEEISISAGKYTQLVKEYTGLETIKTSAGLQDVWNWAFNFEKNTLVVSALDNCLQATSRTIGKLKDDIDKGIRDKQGNVIGKPPGIDTEPPKAFIAHGGESPARKKLVNFLNALGITPIIVEEQPSEGRSKDKNVEHYLKQCDCTIILATKGDVDGQTGEFIPHGNILNEIGRAQEILPDKMIYLLQEETKFPTNIDEKVWERFTEENMDKAFIKVAKELRAFGLIKAVKG